MQTQHRLKSISQVVLKSIKTWSWCVKLLHWLIMSAGTISGLAFLLASLWVSLNANVHSFLLMFMTEDLTRWITQLSITAYVSLPELILGMAVVTTLGHVRMILYTPHDIRPWAWATLFGLPTIIFAFLSAITLGSSVANITYQLPTQLVVVRALAGYLYAFTSLLYTQVGEQQEVDRLLQKDSMMDQREQEITTLVADWNQQKTTLITHHTQEKATLIADWNQQKTVFTTEINALKSEVEMLKNQLDVSKSQVKASLDAAKELQTELDKSSEMALQAYGEDVIQWLKSGIKTADIATIILKTGHEKRRLEAAINKGKLVLSPRGNNLVLISSLRKWLEEAPLPASKRSQSSFLHVVNE